MCGRLIVDDSTNLRELCDSLGIRLYPKTNHDLRPTEEILTVYGHCGEVQCQLVQWGIKPVWAKKLLINAQAETVATKKTFASAFAKRRCLVPCSGWYEWKDEGGPRKQRYRFTTAGGALLMAGIWYDDDVPQLVTLTTEPTEQCAAIHRRMPLLIPADDAGRWLIEPADAIGDLLAGADRHQIRIAAG